MSRVEREASPSNTRMLWNGWAGRDSGARLGDRDSGMPTDDLLYIHKSGKRIDSWNFANERKEITRLCYGGKIESKPGNNIRRKKKRRLMMATRDDRSPTWVSVKFDYVLVVAPSRTTKMNNDIITNDHCYQSE